MSVRYKAVKRKAVGGEHKGEERVYAVAKSAYVCDLDRVSELVASRTALSDSEVAGIIKAFLWVSSVELSNGATLRLGDFVSARVVLRSLGAESVEKLTAAHIKGARVVFKAGPRLFKMARDLKYEVYKPEKETIYIGQPLPPDLDDD